MRTLVWFRGKDVRVADHAPLAAAIAGGEVIPLFVIDPFFFAKDRAKELPHRIQFLLESIASLRDEIARLGSRLLLVKGKSVDVVPKLARQWKVDRVVAHRWCEPFARTRDERVQTACESAPAPQSASAKKAPRGSSEKIRFDLFEGETLIPPGTVRSGSGTPFSVYTPFSRALLRMLGTPEPPARAPRRIPPLPAGVTCDEVDVPALASLGITENKSLVRGGERAAHARLKAFVANAASDYADERNRMDHDGTSRLSQDLHFGVLSPRQILCALLDAFPKSQVHEVTDARRSPRKKRASSASLVSPGSASPASSARTADPRPRDSISTYRNEIVWREFTHHTLWDRPHVLTAPFRRDFTGFPYRFDETKWNAWVLGKTGYPVVDASARQLLQDGFVHNRARMISASFLTKHLLIDYKQGEAHYLKYLTDGDWASNNAGWQWSAGCGCDAQPYFRVFNPVTQGEKFDPSGDYVRKYVPELANMDAKYIHSPWTSPSPPKSYPPPIVDHVTARKNFLETAAKHFKQRRET